jgi:spore coat protein A
VIRHGPALTQRGAVPAFDLRVTVPDVDDIDPTPFATGPMLPPDPTERGFKDTVKANPGYFTTIRARYELPHGVTAPQTYVYHCHIVEHEDNDMMRAFTVNP